MGPHLYGCLLAMLTALLLLGPPWRAAVCRAGPWNQEKPQNVQIYIVDTNFTVKWDWHMKSSENDSTVTFSAYYRPIKEKKAAWKKLPGCQKVTAAVCNFSPELEYFDSYKVQIRAERGNTTYLSDAVSFVPYVIAEVGPPSEVQIECIDDYINLNISAPGNSKRRLFDESDFTYELVIWKNTSSEQPTSRHVCSRDRIDGLALNTTYCLKVMACIISLQKKGPFSPVFCIQTPKVLKPRPENVRVDALNRKFVLKWDWDYSYEQNVSFTVQYARERCLQNAPDKSVWRFLSECQDIITTECDFSSAIDFIGAYSFCVQVSNGTGQPIGYKKIKFEPSKDTEIGPPSRVNVNIIDDLLHIKVFPPGASENQSMTEVYGLSYQVQIWKHSSESKNVAAAALEGSQPAICSNSSQSGKLLSALPLSSEGQLNQGCLEISEKINRIEKQTFFTFSNLEPLAVYCLKVRAVAIEENKTGQFSAVECITIAGNSSFWKSFVIFGVSAVSVAFILAAFFFLSYHVKHWISYVFFPSCKLPSNIEECLQDQHMEKTFLSYAEEPTERCYIIQNILSEETDQTGDNHESKQSKQSSRDSGNYSNEDETGGDVQ